MTIRRSVALFSVLAVALWGCPEGTPDDDDSLPPDGDDDDAAPEDPCEAPEDITEDVDAGESVSGGTNNENDDFTGSCEVNAQGGSPDAIFVFTPSATGTYTVSTEDPSTDFDTLIYAFTDCENPTGTEIGCNDDIDFAAEITTSEMVIDVVAGEPVYLVVDGYDSLGHYEMTVTPTICGDGVVAGAEMCDDGNTEPGDGCDATCVWECTDDDAEDDDSLETATETTLPAEIDGMLCPTDENEEFDVFVDFWAVDLTAGEYAQASVVETGGAACDTLELGLAFYDAELEVLGLADPAEGECPSVSIEATVTGRYWIGIAGGDVTVPPQDYTLTVVAGTSECGDGEVEGTEECDDGNEDDDDECTNVCTENDEPTCDVVGTVTAAVNATGDATGAGDDHVSSCYIQGGEGGEDVVYQFDSDADQVVVVTTNLPGSNAAVTDTVVYVREACRSSASEIACNDDFNDDNYLSELGFQANAGQSYWIIVDTWAADSGPFELGLSIAICGDGEVWPGEQCDDGNTTPGDGCENDCTPTP